MGSNRRKPLEGIRVLEWAAFLNGPTAGVMLAELGAEVIKVEDPVRGDPTRGIQTLWGDSVLASGSVNIAFELANCGKKSLTLDLKQERGRAVLYRLIESLDVFLTNYHKSLASKLGVDYEALSQRNPKIIYASTSGCGARGPDREKRAFDYVGQARSGMMTTMGERGTPPTVMVGAPTDQLGSTMLTLGILAALVARERLGIGQEIETSMLGGAIHMQRLSVGMCLWREREFARHSQRNTRSPFSNYYKCSDGKWILLSEPQVDRFWPQICQALSIPELEKDDRFNNTMGRRQNASELISILNRVFATKTREEWLRILDEEVGIACSPVLSIADLATDPQVLENDYIVELEHPVLGRVKTPGLPITFSQTPPEIRGVAPEHAQHTEEILLDIGGYTWEEIAELREQKVI